jgi:hypothetical protein
MALPIRGNIRTFTERAVSLRQHMMDVVFLGKSEKPMQRMCKKIEDTALTGIYRCKRE